MALCTYFARSNRRNQKLSNLKWVFFYHIRTHSESIKHSAKLMIRVKWPHSAWLSFTMCSKNALPALQIKFLMSCDSRFSEHPLFNQWGWKRGKKNFWSEVSGHVISRDLADRKRKTGWTFCRIASHIILALFIEGCGCSHPQTGKKCMVSHEKKNIVSSRYLPTALVSSRDGWKRQERNICE